MSRHEIKRFSKRIVTDIYSSEFVVARVHLMFAYNKLLLHCSGTVFRTRTEWKLSKLPTYLTYPNNTVTTHHIKTPAACTHGQDPIMHGIILIYLISISSDIVVVTVLLNTRESVPTLVRPIPELPEPELKVTLSSLFSDSGSGS